MTEGTKPVGWCAQCGPVQRIDEDGCCTFCGCSAFGEGAELALANMARLDAAETEIRHLNSVLANVRDGLAALRHQGDAAERERDEMCEGMGSILKDVCRRRDDGHMDLQAAIGGERELRPMTDMVEAVRQIVAERDELRRVMEGR
jgi:hypothetical protein